MPPTNRTRTDAQHKREVKSIILAGARRPDPAVEENPRHPRIARHDRDKWDEADDRQQVVLPTGSIAEVGGLYKFVSFIPAG